MTIKAAQARVLHADCLDAMRNMEADSIDAIVTDPPYGLAFMGKGWDHGVPGVEFWREALRVAKPGAHLVAFGGTRTYHRLACAIEDAGWEVRDCLSWLYGSGFPKSLDVSKAIDKAAGAEREVVGTRPIAYPDSDCWGTPNSNTDGNFENSLFGLGMMGNSRGGVRPVTAPATAAARQWQGWGTALKPAWEPIILARKPLVGTVAANVLAHGTGAINVDACRIGMMTPEEVARSGMSTRPDIGATGLRPVSWQGREPAGRWPANVALDEEAAAMLDEQTGDRPSTLTGRAEAGQRHDLPRDNKSATGYHGGIPAGRVYADSGGASRFFYTAKASRRERGEGNTHPTVKPLALMRWLVKLVTPKGGVVLDPFCGSGTTLVAAVEEGFDCIGIEREAEYVQIIKKRIS